MTFLTDNPVKARRENVFFQLEVNEDYVHCLCEWIATVNSDTVALGE